MLPGKSILDAGRMIKNMAMGNLNGQMVSTMWASFVMVLCMAKGSALLPMVINTLEVGRGANQMDVEYTCTKTAHNVQGIGKMELLNLMNQMLLLSMVFLFDNFFKKYFFRTFFSYQKHTYATEICVKKS
mmetsp:Transcript_29694/g.43216  ORF Transcript_29694/g.43216 Transcript_29694/m.43216 type:complete len:130 (+) Transcript_29694:469-858(+)